MLSTMCLEAKKKIEDAITAYNEALKRGDFHAMSSAEESAKEAEREYAEQAQLDLFSSHKDDEAPILEVLKEGFYGVLRHKPVRDDGVLLGWELVDAERQVDMNAMFKYFRMECQAWKLRCERFTEVLVERIHEDIELDASGVKNAFKMSKGAKEIQVGPKPTSNSSMLKFLQSCIDLIICVPDNDGNNTVRCNNRDLKFLIHCFCGEDKKKRIALKTLKASGVIRIIGKILYRVINDFAYDVTFDKIVEKNDSLEAQRAANRKAKSAVEVVVEEPEPQEADAEDQLEENVA